MFSSVIFVEVATQRCQVGKLVWVYITVRWEKSLCTLPTPPLSQPRLVMEAVVQNPGGSIRSHHPCALGAHTIGIRHQ